MAYCKNCGSLIDDDAKFCGVCGQKVVQPQKKPEPKRQTIYDGNIHKCPNCGATLSSFVKNCPECGYELRDSGASESASEFANRYVATSSNDKKIALIRSYVVPNNKEDILEFVVLASSNIDETSYTRDNEVVSGGVTQQEVSEAWMAKLEQAYQKASILLDGTPEFTRIEKLYKEKRIHYLNIGKKVKLLRFGKIIRVG